MSKVLKPEEIVLQSYFVRGYKTLGSKLIVNQKLIDIYNLVSSLGTDVYYGNYCSKLEEVVSHTRKIFDKYYRLHDVPHIPARTVNDLSDEAAQLAENGDISEIFAYQDKAEETRKMINPFELPLFLGNYSSAFNGGLTIELIGIPHIDYLIDSFIAFPEIFLDSDIGDLSVPVYGHELTHSQLESVKNACHNYQNCEIISIFNEKLSALELDPTKSLLKEIEKRRFKAISRNIEILMHPEEHSPIEIFKSSFYINSTLKATHLFDKYLNGDSDTKERIINGIQRIFDGEISVEDLLDDHNITYENSCNVELVKKHI